MVNLKSIIDMLKPIRPIEGKPGFPSLNQRRYAIADKLKQIPHPLYKQDGHAGRIMTKKAQILFLGEEYRLPDECKEECATGGFDDVFTLNNHQIKYNQWKTAEDVETALIGWYEDNIDAEYHFGSTWGGKGFGNKTSQQITEGLDERYGTMTPDEENQLLLEFNSDIGIRDSMERTIYRMEEANVLLDQVKNGFTERQMKARLRLKLARTGVYRKLLIILDKEELVGETTWKKYKESIIKWYNDNLQFGLTGQTAGSNFNVTNTEDPVMSKEEKEKGEMTQDLLIEVTERLTDMEATFQMLEVQQRNDYGSTTPAEEKSKQEEYYAWLLEEAQGKKRKYNPPTQKYHHPNETQGYQQGQGYQGYHQGQSYQGSHQGQDPNAIKGAPKMPYGNRIKTYDNLFYCKTHGYDVDHQGHNCPDPKWDHDPNTTRDNAHETPGACMKAQHKTLANGQGAGKGWNMEINLGKGRFVQDLQKKWAYDQRHGGRGHNGYGRGGYNGGRGRGGYGRGGYDGGRGRGGYESGRGRDGRGRGGYGRENNYGGRGGYGRGYGRGGYNGSNRGQW